MEKILIFASMALVTFLTRFLMIAVLGREIPPLVQRWLRYVPTAILAALIVPAVLVPNGKIQFGLPALAMLAGALAAWRTRNVFLTMLAGLAVFWVLKVAFGG